MTHELKTWAPYYDAAVSGEKTFEVRRDDRGFQRGDTVTLIRCVQGRSGMWEVDYDIHGQPRATATFRIGWILTGGQFGIESGYVVFALEVVTKTGRAGVRGGGVGAAKSWHVETFASTCGQHDGAGL